MFSHLLALAKTDVKYLPALATFAPAVILALETENPVAVMAALETFEQAIKAAKAPVAPSPAVSVAA